MGERECVGERERETRTEVETDRASRVRLGCRGNPQGAMTDCSLISH